MKSLTLLCLFGLVLIVAGQNSGNDELLQAINAALASWQADSNGAAASWNTWYGPDSTYNNPHCPSTTYPANPTAGGTLAKVLSSKVLYIGSDYPSPPLYFPNGDGTPQGFDVDFANYFVSQLNTQYNTSGITSQRVTDALGNLLTDLDNSTFPFDVASGGIFVTAARAQTVNFACNISVGALSGLVLASSGITDVNDVLKSGVTVGVLADSTQAAAAQTAGATIYPVSLSTPEAALPFLLNNSITAWLGSDTTTAYFLYNTGNTDVSALNQWGTVQGVAWAVRPDTSSSSSDAVSVTATLASVVAGAAALLL